MVSEGRSGIAYGFHAMCLVCGVSDDVYFSGFVVLFPIELEGYRWLRGCYPPTLVCEPIRGMVLV